MWINAAQCASPVSHSQDFVPACPPTSPTCLGKRRFVETVAFPSQSLTEQRTVEIAAARIGMPQSNCGKKRTHDQLAVSSQ